MKESRYKDYIYTMIRLDCAKDHILEMEIDQ